MIPQTTCERCGRPEPTEVMAAGPFRNGHEELEEFHSICKQCRKALHRWLRRPRSR